MNRVVTLLTPVFSIAAAFVAHEANKLLGINLNPEELIALETVAATGAFGIAWKWLHGWQAFEKFQHDRIVQEVEHDFVTTLNSQPTPHTVEQSAVDVTKAAADTVTQLLPQLVPQLAEEVAKLIGLRIAQRAPVATATAGVVAPASENAPHETQQV